jgi:hypothetical protein
MRELDRVIIPEILDSLNSADPRAIRSRRDLRLIDLFLGNSRWIARQLQKQTPPPARIIEIGAGEGTLCRKVQTALPASTVTGLDLIQRPASLPRGIQWIDGDFFQTLTNIEANACIGSLILHHFTTEALRDLGARLQSFRCLVFCEPLRSRVPLFLSKLSCPLLSEVTRHDMPASIRAGFFPGELPALLGLDSKKWSVRESSPWRGVLRLVASQR